MVTSPTADEGSTGFISRVSPVQVRPLLLSSEDFTVSDEPAEEYHLWPETSASQLKELATSPLAYYQRFVAKTAAPKESASLSFGTLLHSWGELGPDEFWKRTVIAPADAVTATGQFGKASAAWLAELKASRPDAIPVSAQTALQLQAQTDQILANSAAVELMASRTRAEFNIRFLRNGHACRCRVDGATAEVFYDFKTCRDVDPKETFHWACVEWKYDLQAALYGMAAVVAGWPRHSMRFIATSNTPPHHCAVMVLPADVLRDAERRVDELLRELDQRRLLDWWSPRGYGEVIEMDSRHFKKKERAW